MILETVEVHNSRNSRLFGLRPTFAAGFLPTSKAAVGNCASLFTMTQTRRRESQTVNSDEHRALLRC
jgi:hypothetical protein